MLEFRDNQAFDPHGFEQFGTFEPAYSEAAPMLQPEALWGFLLRTIPGLCSGLRLQ